MSIDQSYSFVKSHHHNNNWPNCKIDRRVQPDASDMYIVQICEQAATLKWGLWISKPCNQSNEAFWEGKWKIKENAVAQLIWGMCQCSNFTNSGQTEVGSRTLPHLFFTSPLKKRCRKFWNGDHGLIFISQKKTQTLLCVWTVDIHFICYNANDALLAEVNHII